MNLVTGSRGDQAVAWFVRLQECDDEATWVAHRDWLEAAEAHVAAYSAVEETWLDAEDLDAKRREPSRIVDLAEHCALRSVRGRRWGTVWVPAAAAATLVAMVAAPQIGGFFKAQVQRYRADDVHELDVTLTDGTRMTLARGTEVAVRIDGSRRSVALASGRAAFDVHHDAARPFVIAAGDREVRVLGTAFDVLVRDGTFGVSVSRGLVSVSDANAPTRTVRLPAGKALLRLPASGQDRIGSVNPDNATAWKDGRLIYLDSTLEGVGQDYERYIGKPVTVDESVRFLHISGVLKARDEADLIRQLELLLPVRVVRTETGREIRKQ